MNDVPATEIQPPPDDIPPHDYACIRSVGAMRRWEGRWWSWGPEGWRHVPHCDDPAAEHYESEAQEAAMEAFRETWYGPGGGGER